MPLHGSEAFEILLKEPAKGRKVLDLGSGEGEHASLLRAAGYDVTAVSLERPADVVGDYNALSFPRESWDVVWCCHCLEHQANVGAFLRKIREELKRDGKLFVTVPPAKHQIVGGHLTLWNAGLLVYNLIVSGFDCSDARVWSYGYNVSAIVRNREARLPQLRHDCGDIETLARFFPAPVRQGFDGHLLEVRP